MEQQDVDLCLGLPWDVVDGVLKLPTEDRNSVLNYIDSLKRDHRDLDNIDDRMSSASLFPVFY